MLAFLAVGALAIVLGERFVAQLEGAHAAAEQAQEASVREARDYLARGEPGPPDRAWVDLGYPLWQDWYAGTRVARDPGPLAGIAAGAVDQAPAVFRVSRLADPMAAGGYRIENPELAAGAVDLVFVLGLLLPLLIGVLGLHIGSRERETRLDLLIMVQAGSDRAWLIARTLAVGAIAGGAATGLCVAAGLVSGASWSKIGGLVLLTLAYAGLWSGLLLAVNARATTVRGAAFLYGGVWTLLCVLVPTLSAELALGRVQVDYALAETLDARGLRYDAYEQGIEAVLPELYARYPRLETMPAAAADPLDPLIARHAYDGILVAALAERHRVRLAEEQSARQVANWGSWFSPAIALSLTLERFAGVGPDAAAAYRGHLVTLIEARVRWVLETAWQDQPLDAEDFDALVSAAPSSYRPRPSGLQLPLLAMIVWTFAGWTYGLRRLGHSGRQALDRTGRLAERTA
ncbi:MAG: DUF3526 domain-containing protein [Pseudomonadota bacterium]